MDIHLKIGIVLNYKNAEKKKDELFEINSKDYLSSEKIDNELIILRKGKKCVPADVAIGYYIKHNYSDDPNFKIEIDFIQPEQISLARFKKSDIIFIIIFDLLECFHLGSKSNFKKFKHALKNSGNVIPRMNIKSL